MSGYAPQVSAAQLALNDLEQRLAKAVEESRQAWQTLRDLQAQLNTLRSHLSQMENNMRSAG